MNWFRIDQKLPEDHEIVLIEIKCSKPFYCVACFIDEIDILDGIYRKTFFMIAHPRFPKPWLFTEDYKKISRIPKNKVKRWSSLDFSR